MNSKNVFSSIFLSTQQLIKDASVSGLVTGFIVVLVGLTSSAVMVFQAARSAGLDPVQASSWLGSLCFGMGILTIALSMYYRAPILIAWSTAGAAILVSGLKLVPISEATGAFLFSAVLIFLCGITGIFEKIMNRIPMALASALLAGVLLQFSLDSFVAFKTQPFIIGGMILAYLVGKKYWTRWTMLLVVSAGILIASVQGLVHFKDYENALTTLHFVKPELSFVSILSLGLPLFIVTMASQNLTGIAALRVHGYNTPVSPLLSWTGGFNILTAPFGGFAINLAAITAAIAMGKESHPDKEKRYFSAVVAGVIYTVIGIFAAVVTSLFSAFPTEVIAGIAGLALLGTISSCLQTALANEVQKDAAFITFVVAASGLNIFGIGSAFWAIIVGLVAQFILRPQKIIKKPAS